MEHNLKIDESKDIPHVDGSQYRRLRGRLLYLQATRANLAYSINILSQFFSDPLKTQMDPTNGILRYLKSTPGQDIFLPKVGGMNLATCCDTDWLGCSYTRRSCTRYLLTLDGAPISWKTKKQFVVSRSST